MHLIWYSDSKFPPNIPVTFVRKSFLGLLYQSGIKNNLINKIARGYIFSFQ